MIYPSAQKSAGCFREHAHDETMASQVNTPLPSSKSQTRGIISSDLEIANFPISAITWSDRAGGPYFTSVQLSLRKRLHRAGDLPRWNWLAEKVTLRVGASIGRDGIKFFLGLNSLGQNRHADAFAQHHDRTDNGAFFRSDTDE